VKEMSIITAQVKCFLHHERILASTGVTRKSIFLSETRGPSHAG
jgi:hypothetical protein